jgi:RHS repeat-associated protein
MAGPNSATFAYDPFGRRDQKTINGASTQFLYDGLNPVQEIQNGAPSANLITGLGIDEYLQRTDSAGARDYLTDILGATETYTYDGNSNLTRDTDRRGKVTVYQYDGLNRRTFAGFGQNGGSYESTIGYTFDLGDRITQIVDSIAGTTMRQYDGLDDLTEEQTAQGEVGYVYDNARRRQSMTVVGQPTVSYGWDNANRLIGITQGTTTSIPFGYDNADRRTTLTLPNGILLTYTYDNDSRVTAMTWTLAGNAVGDLEYAYDADGRVTQKTGCFAQTKLPVTVTGNTFNAANEMTAFNGTPMTYDANGNLTNDGTNIYSWDARNHLASLSGANAASFTYDAAGRRAQKTINGVSTQFLYDGSNPVQEIQNGTPSANLLTGLGIDEYFQRTDSAGARDYLTDILGSTLSLTDSSGTNQTSYTYDPFGNSAATGQASSNSLQFTGRENDGTGLYLDRARYYGPTFQRFVSQDPSDFADADPFEFLNNDVSEGPTGFDSSYTNLYAYVGDDPADWFDPDGMARKGGGQGKGERGRQGKNPNPRKHVRGKPGCYETQNPDTGKWTKKPKAWVPPDPNSQFQLPPPPPWLRAILPILPFLPWPGNPIWLGG